MCDGREEGRRGARGEFVRRFTSPPPSTRPAAITSRRLSRADVGLSDGGKVSVDEEQEPVGPRSKSAHRHNVGKCHDSDAHTHEHSHAQKQTHTHTHTHAQRLKGGNVRNMKGFDFARGQWQEEESVFEWRCEIKAVIHEESFISQIKQMLRLKIKLFYSRRKKGGQEN